MDGNEYSPGDVSSHKSGSIAGDSIEVAHLTALRSSRNSISVPALKVSLNNLKRPDSFLTRSNENIDCIQNSPFVTGGIRRKFYFRNLNTKKRIILFLWNQCFLKRPTFIDLLKYFIKIALILILWSLELFWTKAFKKC